MRLLSYNTFWKIMDPSPDKNFCLKNSKNICSNNVKEIILNIGKEKNEIYPNYDFISLQECSLKNLKKLNFPSQFINNYKKSSSKYKSNTIITLYNKKYHPIKKFKGNLSNSKDHRPFLILIFKENIIHINVHFPHFDIEKAYLKLFKILFKIPQFNNYQIIFNGDFNHPPDIKIINKIMYPHKFFKNPKLNTCCFEHKHDEYTERFDNIFTTISKPKIYKTLKKKSKYIINHTPLMSDHLPVYSMVPNTLTA